VQLECVVNQVIPLGEGPGAGNLVLAEIKLIHIQDEILDDQGKIDQAKIDLVARLGGDWYCRVGADNLFSVAKPIAQLGMGMDALPPAIKSSTILTANNLAALANEETMPSAEAVESVQTQADVKEVLDATIGDSNTRNIQLQILAKSYLDRGEVVTAWKILLL